MIGENRNELSISVLSLMLALHKYSTLLCANPYEVVTFGPFESHKLESTNFTGQSRPVILKSIFVLYQVCCYAGCGLPALGVYAHVS